MSEQSLSRSCGSSTVLFIDPSLELVISNGVITTPYGAVGREIDALADVVSNLFLCGPTKFVDDDMTITDNYRFEQSNITAAPLQNWIDRGNKRGFFRRPVKNGMKVSRSLSHYVDCCDMVWIRTGNHPVSIIAAGIALLSATPYSYSIGADLVETTEQRLSSGISLRQIPERVAVKLLQFGGMQAAKAADCVFVHGGELYEQYEHVGNVHPRIISTVSEKDIISEVNTETAEPFELLFVGRLSEEKGVDTLLHAAAKVERNVKVTLIGDGPMRPELEQLATELGIEGAVNFQGYIPFGENLLNEYRQHDGFVLPSRSEGQGRVLLEAMAGGLPIIASNVGGIPEVIDDGATGILVPPDSPAALTTAIEDLISSVQLRNKLAENGRKWVSKHTVEAETKRVVARLEEEIQ
jgi:glycosyltransferase involved in cell wall biosynthesis